MNVEIIVSYPHGKLLEVCARATLMRIPRKKISALLSERRRYRIELCIVSARKIKRLNRKFLGKNKVTDVLSFPQLVPDIPAFSEHVGDVVICSSVAKTQARQRGRPLDEILAELVVHGVLHLFGYDHEEDKQARQMFTLQRRCLRSLANRFQRVEPGSRSSRNNRRKKNQYCRH